MTADSSLSYRTAVCRSGIQRSQIAVVLFALSGAGAAMAEPLTVAFLGDQGATSHSRAVLQLVKDEGTDLLVLAGDMGYDDSPEDWGRMMDEVLGDRFPVLSVAGNHDRHEWTEYERWLEDRIDAVDGLSCSGAVGVKARCTYRDLSIVQTAPNVNEVSEAGRNDDYEGFIDAAFKGDPARWRICSFHKNMQDMQVGGKSDATGWGVFEACRRAGAMVATGHEHSYSRTHLMDGFEELSVVNRESRLVLQEGRSFAFVSGLGGRGIRDQERDGDWWASIFAEQQGADYGALFCRYDGDIADCEFKSVSGTVPDRFTLESRVGTGASAANSSLSDTGEMSVDEQDDVIDTDEQTGSSEDATTDAALVDDSTSDEASAADVSDADSTDENVTDDQQLVEDVAQDELHLGDGQSGNVLNEPVVAGAGDVESDVEVSLDDESVDSNDDAVATGQDPDVVSTGGGTGAAGLSFSLLLAIAGLRRRFARPV